MSPARCAAEPDPDAAPVLAVTLARDTVFAAVLTTNYTIRKILLAARLNTEQAGSGMRP